MMIITCLFVPSEQVIVHCPFIQEVLVEPEHCHLTAVAVVSKREIRITNLAGIMMDTEKDFQNLLFISVFLYSSFVKFLGNSHLILKIR